MSLAYQVALRTRWLRRAVVSLASPDAGQREPSPVPDPSPAASAAADPVPVPDPSPAASAAPVGSDATESVEAPPKRRAARSRSPRPASGGTSRSPRRRRVAAEPPEEPVAAEPPEEPVAAERPDEPVVAERPDEPVAPVGRSHDVRILLVEDVPQVADRIRELLRSQDTFKLVAVVADGRRVDEGIAEHCPDVVIVDTLLQGRVKGSTVIERLRRTRRPLPCVAITLSDRPLTPDVEASVDSVLAFPFGTFDLIRSIRGAVTSGAARNPTLASRIVAVFSAKGGVGKTTIALNLAVALQEMGLRTALVDGSLQFGDVRRMLGAADDIPSIIDLPTDAVRSSDLVELLMPGPAGVDVLLAPPRLEQAELVTTRDLDKILDMLRRTYHAVVIDTPSSLNETTLALLDAADLVVQVVTPETAALDITLLASQAFAGIGYPPTKLRLLLNRADTQGSVGRGQIRQALGRDPDHTVASDWALVAQSNDRGVPFVTASPDAPVSADLRAVASQVAAVVGAMPADPVVTKRRRGRS